MDYFIRHVKTVEERNKIADGTIIAASFFALFQSKNGAYNSDKSEFG